MTAIDRTIYRRMKRSYTTKELIEAYTPTPEERRFVSTMRPLGNNGTEKNDKENEAAHIIIW